LITLMKKQSKTITAYINIFLFHYDL